MTEVAMDLREKIRVVLADTLGVSPDQIDDARSFEEHGLGSVEGALFIGALEDLLDKELSPLLPYDHPTVEALASALASIES
jgi:acyl carrier protein